MFQKSAGVAQRPRYVFTLVQERSVLDEQLSKSLHQAEYNPLGLEAVQVSGHYLIRFPRPLRRFGSPQLDLSIEAETATRTRVRLLLAPAPALWTFFMFLYAMCSVLFLGGLMLGYSQYALGKPASWLGLSWLSGGLAALVYLAALYGKWSNRHQSGQLLTFAERALHTYLHTSQGPTS